MAEERRGGRRVTMAAVGRLAGVTQGTVSRALSDPSRVSPATMARIQDAIRITGFVPNAAAGALASRRSMLIGALVPSITNVMYTTMFRAFSERMQEKGYQFLLTETGLDPVGEESKIALHMSRQPDAIMLTGIHHTPTVRRTLLAAELPVVELWDITDTPIDICVGFSHPKTGRAVADFVADQGYRQTAMIHAGDARALRRMAGFAERIAELGGPPPFEINLHQPASFPLGREGLSRLLAETGFDGGLIQCSSDLLAHGVIVEAQARGLNVPQDIAVTGFGDQDFAAAVEPGITTIRIDYDGLGQCAADTLLMRLRGETPERLVHDVGFEIVRRGSA